MGWVWTVAFLEGLYVCGVLGQAAVAALAGARVELISLGYGPPLARRGRVQLGVFPLGGFIRVAGLHATEATVEGGDPRAFFRRPLPLRALIVLGWPIGAQLFVIAFAAASALAFGQARTAGVVASTVAPGSPAEQAGVNAGDEIVTVDGQQLAAPETLAARVSASEGRPIVLEVRRAGERRALTVTPRRTPEGIYRIGITQKPIVATARPDVGSALAAGARAPFAHQGRILDAFAQVLSGRVKAELVGPVGVAAVVETSETTVQKAEFLSLMGAYWILLSLLPLPPLPGGQLLLVLLGWRSPRRRSDSPARDLGELPRARGPFPAALLAALLPLAVLIVLFALSARSQPVNAARAALLALSLAALALRRPRAWAWGVYLPLLLLPSLLVLGPQSGEPWLVVAVACAFLLVIPATLLLPPLRRAFGRACPACGRLAASPVRSARRMSCLACGSGWRVAVRP